MAYQLAYGMPAGHHACYPVTHSNRCPPFQTQQHPHSANSQDGNQIYPIIAVVSCGGPLPGCHCGFLASHATPMLEIPVDMSSMRQQLPHIRLYASLHRGGGGPFLYPSLTSIISNVLIFILSGRVSLWLLRDSIFDMATEVLHLNLMELFHFCWYTNPEDSCFSFIGICLQH